MKLKTIIELLTLSTSLYAISKDEKLMNELGSFAEKGKDSLEKLIHNYNENEYGEQDEESEGQKMIQQFFLKTSEAKEELYLKIEEIAIQMYAKMNIAHTNDLGNLTEELKMLKLKLEATEAKVVALEKLQSAK